MDSNHQGPDRHSQDSPAIPSDDLFKDCTERKNLADRVSARFEKAYSRFLEDVEEMVEEMGGVDYMKVTVGPGGLRDFHVEYVV